MNMRSSSLLAASLVALACAPVVRAQTILFSDDFDAGTSASRYTFFSYDRDTNTGTMSGVGTFLGDVSANFNFNYGAYTYRTTSQADGLTPVLGTIPAAPHSVGGSTVGLRLDANNANGGYAMIQALPKLTEYAGGAAPSGDYKLQFDLFIDYNGPSLGGGGSTEYFITGINQDGISPGGPRVGTETFGPGSGMAMAVDGELGNGVDYRIYQGSTRLGSLDLPTGYIAQNGTNGPANGLNDYYQGIFPFVPNGYETPGAPGKVWNTVEVSVVDGIYYFSINGHLIAARSDPSTTSGNVMLGYGDILSATTTSAAVDDQTGLDANFAIFDNVVVQQLTQTRPTWNANADGVWSDAGKWTNGVPDGDNTTADFTSAAAGPHTITVDGNKTVRSIVFDNANRYTLTGGTLTLSAFTQADVNNDGSPDHVLLTGVNGSLVVKNGSHTIDSTIVVNTPLAVNVVPAASTLTLSGDVITNDHDVIKSGAGAVEVKNVRTAGNLAINGGTMRVISNGTDAGVSKVGALTIAGTTDAWAGKLDVNDNSVVIDYATTSPLATVQNQLKNGFAGGSWTGNGIASSAAAAAAGTAHKTAIGYTEATGLFSTFPATFKGQTVDDTAIILQYTAAADANLDGKVDTLDFNNLAANFGGSGKVWTQADFNYDGIVDTLDFNALAANFGFALPGAGRAGGTLVPEPTGLALLILALPCAVHRRRRQG